MKSRLKGLALRVAVAFAGLLLSLAVIAGLTRPAGRYFYCEAMGMLPFDPCAQAADDEADHDSSSTVREQHPDCCERITIQATPRGATASAPNVPPPALIAILPPPGFPRVLLDAPPGSPTSTFERWRVPRRPPGPARAQLMVFLT